MKQIWNETKFVGEATHKIYLAARTSAYGRFPARVHEAHTTYRATCRAAYDRKEQVLKVDLRFEWTEAIECADELKREVVLLSKPTPEEAIREVIFLFDSFAKQCKTEIPPSDERTDDEVIAQALAADQADPNTL